MDLWDRSTQLLLQFIDQYDDQAIFLLLFLEECGIPLPLPGDLYMVLAGYRAALGKMSLLWALLLVEAASVAGASLLYWFASRGGRPLIYRFGRYVFVDRARLDAAECWLMDRGAAAIVVGRLTPGLRLPTVVAAGVFGIPFRTFLPAVALGSLPYDAFFVLLGYWAGPYAIDAFSLPRLSVRVIATAIVFVLLAAVLLVIYRRIRRTAPSQLAPAAEARRIETSALAGFLATVQMGMGVNLLLYAFGALGVFRPETSLHKLLDLLASQYADDNGLRLAAYALTFLVLGGIGWAIAYTHIAEPFLPGPFWFRGLAFSALPLAVSVLVVLPLLGAGPLGLELGMGLVPLAGEVVRHALYGIGLGVSYTLLRAARQARSAAPRAESWSTIRIGAPRPD